jgi:hypothetical protein
MIEQKLDALIRELPLLKDQKSFFAAFFSYLKKPVENESPIILRAQIAEAYVHMPYLIKLVARSEAIYRISQGQMVGMASLKGTGREAEINGNTAHHRYCRDYLEGLLNLLNSRLSASKAILASLDNEIKCRVE